jgi:hypothetical protein
MLQNKPEQAAVLLYKKSKEMHRFNLTSLCFLCEPVPKPPD